MSQAIFNEKYFLAGTKSGEFGNFQNESLCIIPAKTWICDGLTIDAVSNLLIAFFYVALDHYTLNKSLDIRVKVP